MSKGKHAAIVVGHGSIHSDSGKSMIRIAARLREQQVAPIVEAGFLNYNQPTLADALEKCCAQGATQVTIQPYFLIDGQYASRDLPDLVGRVAASTPDLQVAIGATLGYHPALYQLTKKRILAVDPTPEATTALLLVAHGTPIEPANAPIEQTATLLGSELGYGSTLVGYLDCNQPTIPDAIDQLVAQGHQRIVIQPYFLHIGRHVRTDLPHLFAAARERHSAVTMLTAHHLDYDALLVDALADRISATVQESWAIIQEDTHTGD